MKTIRLNPSTLLLLCAALFLSMSACMSPEKMIELGDYDGAIHRSMKKLRGKKKKAKFVASVEEAFAKATARDMAEVERLKYNGEAANWEQIHRIYQRIDERQAAIEPLLPLIDKRGYKASFQFVRVTPLLKESREKAAVYQYERGQMLLTEAQRGDRYAARQAYAAFAKSEDYIRDFRDVRRKKREAEDLGVAHILFQVQNRAEVVVPRDFERELLRMTVSDLDNRWNRYHTKERPGIDYAYRIDLNLTEVAVGPGFVESREFEEVKEIEEGTEPLVDADGYILTDSLGNEILVPKKILISARVLETRQHKTARVAGRLEYRDLQTNELISSEPIASDAVFDNLFATFIGDYRALSPESRTCLGKVRLPFPQDLNLLLQAAEALKPVVKQQLSRTTLI
ncbi:MAG: hypothetical protein AAFP19_12060 [Bacteroidota bacterium]